MAKLPLKFRILHFISKNDSVTDSDIMNGLKDEYGQEGQFTEKMINLYLQSLKAVGIIDAAEVYIDENNKLRQKYKITDYGIQRLKYLPADWK